MAKPLDMDRFQAVLRRRRLISTVTMVSDSSGKYLPRDHRTYYRTAEVCSQESMANVARWYQITGEKPV